MWGQVAYASLGSGPPLVFDTGWVSDLEAMWDHGGYRGLVESLAEAFRVLSFDPPGTGLSERERTTSTIDDEVAVLESVLDAAKIGSSRVSLFSSSIAASTAVRFAATHPQQVERLILYGGALRGDDLGSEVARSSLLSLLRGHWGIGSRTITDLFVPDASPGDRDWFDAWQRKSADGETVARRLELYYSSDVTADAARVSAPTTVLHREDDRAIRSQHGRALAAAISGATYRSLSGSSHLCFFGDWQGVSEAALEFLRTPIGSALPVGPYGEFTARELDVAELVTEGLSNAAAGERLGISPRTVETHLTRIREKLGVSTRAEVAAWMARRSEFS